MIHFVFEIIIRKFCPFLITKVMYMHIASKFFFFSNLLLLLHNRLVTLSGLILIFNYILLLKLAHALDLIQVDYEAFIVSMQRLYALTAEDVQMV